MKRKFGILLTMLMFLFVGCSSETDSVQKFIETMPLVYEQEFYHVKESVVYSLDGEVQTEQSHEVFYSDGAFYIDIIQDEMSKTSVMYSDNMAYVSRTSMNENPEWVEETNVDRALSYLPWLMQLEGDDNFPNEEYISIEETSDGIVVTYDRGKEVEDADSEYNVTKETYYFDMNWNLLSVEMVATAVSLDENGELQEMDIVTTTEFVDTTKEDIENKIRSEFLNVL